MSAGPPSFRSAGRICFQLPEATHTAWPMNLPPPQRQQCSISVPFFPGHIPPDPSAASPSFKDACDYIGPIPTAQENPPISGQWISYFNSICSLNSPSPCNITCSWVLGSMAGTCLGVHCSAYHSQTEPAGNVIFG